MIIRLRRQFLLTLLVMAAIVVKARVWTAEDVPMVHLQDRNRYVTDPDNLLSTQMRDSADIYLSRLNEECGVQTVFVVVGRVKEGDPFRMAQDIGNNYGVGTKKDRRGLVIVIAVEDRRYFIAPGKGLEGELTDVESDDIARACIVRYMKINNIDQAVLQTSKAIYNKIKSGRTGIDAVDNHGKVSKDDWSSIIFLLVFFFGAPIFMFIRFVLEIFGIVKKRPNRNNRRHNNHDDWFPPFIFGGGGGFGGGSIGGSFGGGSFGGGGAGGGW
ncbi:MAG: TPM domain-containing protein [Prevotella sp.]|nr:TPM domain-containing protein [Prevotella sp.]MDD3388579.1 TPM domain-containing protein [Prevotella sp.]